MLSLEFLLMRRMLYNNIDIDTKLAGRGILCLTPQLTRSLMCSQKTDRQKYLAERFRGHRVLGAIRHSLHYCTSTGARYLLDEPSLSGRCSRVCFSEVHLELVLIVLRKTSPFPDKVLMYTLCLLLKPDPS